MTTVVLGIGTGRCGTQSLSTLLDSQPDAQVTHERFRANVPWGAGGYEWIRTLLDQRPPETTLFGDVSLYWLPQIERLLLDAEKKGSETAFRIVALRRNRDATVDSYLRKTGGPAGRNHWMVHDGTTYRQCDLGWDHCYPKFRTETKREAISMYWAFYYGEVDRLEALYPEHVRCFDLDTLNTEEGQSSLLRFVGVPDAQQVLRVGIQKNVAPAPKSAPQTVGSSLRGLYNKIIS